MDIVPAPDTVAGRRYNRFHEEIDATGWHIEIIIPDEELFHDLNHIGSIVGLLMIIGLALLVFIMSRSTKAMRNAIEFAEKNQRMEGELEVAQTIQMAMLPKVFPPFADRLDLNVYGIVNPAKEVGGDLYDFYVRSEKLFFCVGDVSGKGVPAALIMATTRSLFRSVTAHEEEAAEIVSEMNNALAEANEQNMFITLFLGVLDLNSGKLEYCNAGHNAPVVMRGKGQETRKVEVVANIPIGVMADYPYQAQEMEMAYNDLLFLYTDGLTEAENTAHAQYGEERMMAALERARAYQPRFMVEAMQREVTTFAGAAPQSDDLTMLAIRYQQPALFMRNDIQQIPTLAEWVEWLNIPTELSMSVNLALEEIVANVMLYAYPHNRNGRVLVESWRNRGAIYFAITDSGIEFDPTAQKEADTTLPAEEREIGGLGIHIVRHLMDEITYRRQDGQNILILAKQLDGETTQV
jgi:sigma-B regulation protein RsbU (phosphoserine phosphatase)